jgi:hypothetical protein
MLEASACAPSGSPPGVGRQPSHGRPSSVSRSIAWLGLGVTVLVAAGCAPGPRAERRDARAEVRVTRDFGQEDVAAARAEKVQPGETVLRLLQSSQRVKTSDEGRSVQAIGSVAGEGPGGRRDWFSYVNGVEVAPMTVERVVAPGDIVQWDFRRRDVAMRVPAIVGAFPEPFRNGIDGKRIPARVECEDDRGPACDEVKRRLEAQGVIATQAPFGTAAGPKVGRIVVAAWPRARTLRTAAVLDRGPGESGVFARFGPDGRRLELLGADGVPVRAAPAGTGLVAATRQPNGELLWLVTGGDARGVEAAARALDPAVLRDAFAVAVEPPGPVRLPLGARTVVGRAARP